MRKSAFALVSLIASAAVLHADSQHILRASFPDGTGRSTWKYPAWQKSKTEYAGLCRRWEIVRRGIVVGGLAEEKPRHDMREAGLVVTSDLCPVTPGSFTRLSTSLQFPVMSAA